MTSTSSESGQFPPQFVYASDGPARTVPLGAFYVSCY